MALRVRLKNQLMTGCSDDDQSQHFNYENNMPKTITVTAKIKAPKHENEMYDRTQLTNGIAIEREHTSSRQLAALIAKNHLDESPDYYKKLKAMEKK